MPDTARMSHRPLSELEAGLEEVRQSPADTGTLRAIVRRPATDERELTDVAQLNADDGLVGDTWKARGSRSTADGSADRTAQVTLMNARLAELITGSPDPAHWAIAGDQLYVDFDLSEANLPPGTRLVIGDAELEVSATPHTGCAKFSARFGVDALRLVSTPEGRAMRLRGMNATVVRTGTVRQGDRVTKI